MWLLFDVGSWDHDQIPFPELMASFLYVIEMLIENEETQVSIRYTLFICFNSYLCIYLLLVYYFIY